MFEKNEKKYLKCFLITEVRPSFYGVNDLKALLPLIA